MYESHLRKLLNKITFKNIFIMYLNSNIIFVEEEELECVVSSVAVICIFYQKGN